MQTREATENVPCGSLILLLPVEKKVYYMAPFFLLGVLNCCTASEVLMKCNHCCNI